MKRFRFCLALISAVLLLGLTAQRGEAAGFDMKLGKFTGNWCGFEAEFDVTSIDENGDFKGTVFLPRTKQLDEMTIRQRDNKSLRIVRHLSGNRTGENQWVDTHPPEKKRIGKKTMVNFPVRRAGGFGAKVLGFLLMPQ